MRGPLALVTEVVGRANDSLAEMVLPQAVHENPSNERVRRIGDGLRQFEAAAAGVAKGRPVKRGQERSRRLDARRLVVAADEDMLVAAGAVAHSRCQVRLGNLRLQFADAL